MFVVRCRRLLRTNDGIAAYITLAVLQLTYQQMLLLNESRLLFSLAASVVKCSHDEIDQLI